MRETKNNDEFWPRISVVTPSYNQGKFIENTILSVISQNYPNLEYIIIDGGSTDGSVEIIKKYSSKLSYWSSEPDNGHGNALNKGFSHATGEIMAWINSDDMYLPWTFSIVAEIFKHHKQVNWITGYNSWWDIQGRQIKVNPIYKNIYDFILGNYAWIQQESVFWRRSLWERAGGKINEKYKLMVDGELWCRFFAFDDLWHVDCVLGGYRNHDSNRAAQYREQAKEEMEALISELKTKLSIEVERNMNYLKHIKKLKKIFKLIDIDKIAHKLLKKRFQDINYKHITFINGKWIPSYKRYEIK